MHLNFWRHVLWSEETKIDIFDFKNNSYIWRVKGEVCKLEYTIPTVKHRGVLLQEGLVYFTK